MDDILYFKDKNSYRLGTIVVHKDKDKFYIVDGQQRVVTLILLLKAIKQNEIYKKFIQEYDKDNSSEIKLPDLKFSNDISVKNIIQNYQELEKRVNQIKTVYMIDDFDVIIECVSNAVQLFYICINKDASDIKFEYNLEKGMETGHVQTINL